MLSEHCVSTPLCLSRDFNRVKVTRVKKSIVEPAARAFRIFPRTSLVDDARQWSDWRHPSDSKYIERQRDDPCRAALREVLPLQTIRERAKQQLPSVLLTLLSIIQAVALELLWSSVLSHPHLWQGGLPAVVGWLQAAVAMMGFVLIWLVYVSMVLRVVWVPRILDTVYPFVIGLLEFVLAEMLQPGSVALWFVVLAAACAATSFATLTGYRSARRDPANAELFAQYSTYSTRDRLASLSLVAGMLVPSALIAWVGGEVVSILGLLVAMGLIAGQYRVVAGYWNRALGPEEMGDIPSGPEE
ncbi:MAG: hypothetical protein P8M78_18020 [Myxococcota bacterium]|nr:hypothetical protein [Myxococcota bacterium]